jgi:hypothetical protein
MSGQSSARMRNVSSWHIGVGRFSLREAYPANRRVTAVGRSEIETVEDPLGQLNARQRSLASGVCTGGESSLPGRARRSHIEDRP